MNKKGFSLIELIITVVILGLVVMIAVPNIQEALGNSKTELIKINKEQIEESAKILVDEVIYCNMSETTINIVGNSCSTAKNTLISGLNNININDLDLENVSGKCSGTIDIKIDKDNYKVTINTDKVICNL